MTITINPLIIILLVIVCIIIGAVTYFCCDVLSVSSFCKKIHFNEEQKKIKEGLIEKKNIVEKEMTEEIKQAISKKRQELSQLDRDYEQKFHQYQRNTMELDSRYNQTREAYERMDREAEIQRQKENAEIIAAAAKEREQRIATINAQYEKEKDKAKVNFQIFSDEINSKKAALTEEIKAFEARQAVIIAQFKKDEEVRKKRDFYHITITDQEAEDIKRLRKVADELHNPAVLYKLIWENYYKNKFSELVGRVVGDNKKATGIYKITNINNEKTYIGQTKAGFENRWRTHIRRGLKAEPTTNNKLYAEMWNEGPENFTWEIIECCAESELTAREKFYINFYKSMEWGYNAKS